MPQNSNDGPDDPGRGDTPAILRYIEPILSDPKEIRREALALLEKCRKAGGGGGGKDGGWRTPADSGDEDRRALQRAAKKVISNYSYLSGMTGGASALAGIVPGLGSVLAAAGGTVADVALLMKWNIEMVMALATIYGHDVTDPQVGRLCYVIAGLGATAEAGKKGAEKLGNKAFVRLVQKHLAGGALVAVREAFKKIGVTFTRKALVNVAPFGIGVVIGFSVNKTLTYYVGQKAVAYFETE